MTPLKFNEGGVLIPQKINYDVKHNEQDEEFIEKYMQDHYNFDINYKNKGNLKIIKKK